MDYTGLHWARQVVQEVQVVQVVQVIQVVQVVQVVQMVRVARTISLDNMQSENVWFSWSKPSKYREKLICHASDGGRTDEQRKVENRAVFCRPETAMHENVVRYSVV